MNPRQIDLKGLVLLLIFCFSIGAGIGYISEKVHWITGGFIVLFAIWCNGLVISWEDRLPGGWDFEQDESEKSKLEFKRSFLLQIILTCFALILGICSHIYIST